MFRSPFVLALHLVVWITSLSGIASAEPTANRRQLYEQAAPSVVAVRYMLETELNRTERICAGVIVNADGLVMLPLAAMDDRFPDEQMKDFKIIVPRSDTDAQEFDAAFEGRDQRYKVAFVRTSQRQTWNPVRFEQLQSSVGEEVFSVGVMPASAGYRTYLMRGFVSGSMGGEVKRVMIGDGGLAAAGSPVFNADGKAIGFVNYHPPFPLFLNDKDSMMALISPPKFFTPTSEIAEALAEPPTGGHPVPAGWAGLPELTALPKEEAERLGLASQPAVRIGTVIAGSPADKAGLKRDDVIVRFNGRPLERGDHPQDLPQILNHKLICLKPDTAVTLSILAANSQTSKDVQLVLAAQPKPASMAARYWAKDLGFGVREMVPFDFYSQNLRSDIKGLCLTVVKPRSPAAACRLSTGDVVLQINGQPVGGIDLFRSTYEDFRKSNPDDNVMLLVLRSGREETVSCQAPR